MTRKRKVEVQIKREIVEIFQKKIQDDRIGFISFTDVTISKDFSYAKVFYSQIGTEKQKAKTNERLLAITGLVKFELGKILRLRTVPDIKFVFDKSLEVGVDLVNKINALKDQ
jgi:ribosome-binding factor A